MKIERIEATSEGMPERIRLTAGAAVAEVVPSAGMAMVSLTVEGREHLAMPAELTEFMRTARTGGIPLLYPWANRLRSDRYSFKGASVDLSKIADLKRDGNDLPMHGLLLRFDGWAVDTATEGDSVVVRGTIDWETHEHLMRAFPFPHQVTVTWALSVADGSVRVTSTILVESHAGDVPVAAGWHPYLAPPVKDRADLVIEGPPLGRMKLNDEGLPVLEESGDPVVGNPESLNGPLGARVYDDLFAAPEEGFKFTIHGDSTSVSISGGQEWNALQVYAKAGGSFVCVEPMAARTAGLSDGAIYDVATPKKPVRASCTVKIDH